MFGMRKYLCGWGGENCEIPSKWAAFMAEISGDLAGNPSKSKQVDKGIPLKLKDSPFGRGVGPLDIREYVNFFVERL